MNILVSETMGVTVQSRRRVYPESHGLSAHAKTEALSIFDNTVLNYATSGCIWFCDQSLNVDQLTLSLKKTLDVYPQWAGVLHFAEYIRDGSHTHRQGRMQLNPQTQA